MKQHQQPKPELLDTAIVKQHFEEAQRFAVTEIRRDLESEWTSNVLELPFGSPIEVVFYVWFSALRRVNLMDYELDLRPQVEANTDGDTYRLDFSVLPENVDEWREAEETYGVFFPKIGVELDGHDFHEKTKQQVTYRNKRDRALQRAGWKVFHYSGSELWKEAQAAATEVFEYSGEQLHEFRRRLRKAKHHSELRGL